MKKTDPILNDDMVVVHASSGLLINTKFGNLKRDFIAGKVTYHPEKIYLPRTNSYWFVTYHSTKGFRFEKIKGEKKNGN